LHISIGYLRRKEGRGFCLVCFQFFQRIFGQFFIRGWGKNVILTCEWVRGVSLFFLVCFCFFVAYKVKEPQKTLNTTLQTFAGVSAQEEPPVPRNPPTNFIESSVPHKPTNKQTTNLTCKRKELEAGLFLLFTF